MTVNLNEITLDEIIEHYGECEILEHIGMESIVSNYGSEILNSMSAEDVVEFFDDSELIDSIGVDNIAKHVDLKDLLSNFSDGEIIEHYSSDELLEYIDSHDIVKYHKVDLLDYYDNDDILDEFVNRCKNNFKGQSILNKFFNGMHTSDIVETLDEEEYITSYITTRQNPYYFSQSSNDSVVNSFFQYVENAMVLLNNIEKVFTSLNNNMESSKPIRFIANAMEQNSIQKFIELYVDIFMSLEDYIENSKDYVSILLSEINLSRDSFESKQDSTGLKNNLKLFDDYAVSMIEDLS